MNFGIKIILIYQDSIARKACTYQSEAENQRTENAIKMDKNTYNGRQTIIQKTNPGMVSSSCSVSGTSRITIIKNKNEKGRNSDSDNWSTLWSYVT